VKKNLNFDYSGAETTGDSFPLNYYVEVL